MKTRNKTYIAFIFSLVVILGMASCGEDTDKELNVPDTYEFLRNGDNTVSFSGQTTRILMSQELVSKMSDFTTSESTLLEMFSNSDSSGGDVNPFSNEELNSSTKSIKSKVAASADFFSTNTAESATIKAQFDSWIKNQVEEIFPNENELAQMGVAGQIADGTSSRYVSGKGLEYNQLVAKGLIGALMADQIVNNYLSPAVLDAGNNVEENNVSTVVEGETYTNMEHKWDEAYGYLFGKSANSATPLDDLGADNFLNKYLKRVNDDSDFTGIAATIYNAFKKGRAAIVEEQYTERDKQADIIKEKISEIIGIRAVYYLQQGKNALPASGTAFHDLSEGLGFVYSLRFTRQAGTNSSYFTKEEVDGFMNDLLAENGFWDVTPETLDNISEAIASKFDFTVAQAAE